MRLRIELFTNDLEKSIHFYKEVLGLELGGKNSTYAELISGPVEIGICAMEMLHDDHPLKAKADERKGLGVELVIEVADVEESLKKVAASGYPVHSGLAKQPWGDRDFRLLDPDGYYIRVTES